ncbi:cobyric acid synthase [Trichloromonas sp.]|uniref:cobyric acid synthase n=1 Tax=Trichloromonas sp. TaxID=3069249 RepID=UPI001DBCA06A|nr:cobyric acid synthase [Desulfuromonadaceae bacterium]MDY0269864.1 cobyric acid synthase [Trichloromonas sp.]
MSNTLQHGGNLLQATKLSGLPVEELVDFSANINPLGFPTWLRPLISSQVESLVHYPDPEATELSNALAADNGVSAEQVLVGNGASELLYQLPAALKAVRMVLPVPCYIDYARAALRAGCPVLEYPTSANDGFVLCTQSLSHQLRAGDMVMLGQPNNPTGVLTPVTELVALAATHPQVRFVIDESFIDLVEQPYTLRSQRPFNMLIVQSMTKSWAIPGLRLGYLLGEAELIAAVRRQLPEWSVNHLALSVGVRALQDREFLPRTRVYVAEQRRKLFTELADIDGISPYPGQANFLLVKVQHPRYNGTRLAQALLQQGILLRDCRNFNGLGEDYLRIAVRNDADQKRLINAMRTTLRLPVLSASPRKTPALMFQGTGSNVGKSILTAAMCRILQQDGIKVAPFKAQNMSLNSCVTFQGGEMGRAQVLQAQACRLDPDVRMNPLLLKPSSATGSQVILCGKVLETMDFRDYSKRRETLFAKVKECYDGLAAENQVMVLEGAGSPAEINLKDRDIVNMNMARHAEAGVLLVGDIDRGGVFASFVGTMELLNEWERALVRGFIINRFRGDASLLAEALSKTTLHTGKPFWGNVPYLANLGLPEEDSVDFKDGRLETQRGTAADLDIALIDLPHISNFTDVDALRLEPDVRVRKVTDVPTLGTPDAVILPGSKNVINDLVWLRSSGLAAALQHLADSATVEIVGICGGYQMLGKEIDDPHAIESAGDCCRGLDLLPMRTQLQPHKITSRCRAQHIPSGETLTGYEIHHGIASEQGAVALITLDDGTPVGSGAPDHERIWGTYLHGVFDADGFRRWFLNRLRQHKGLQPLTEIQAVYDLEPALDRLAGHVRASLDMNRVYQLLGL